MKKLLLTVTVASFILGFSVKEKETDNPETDRRGAIYSTLRLIDSVAGDFNGDNVTEFAWVQKTAGGNSGELVIPNICTVKFSDERIPALNTDLYCLFGNLWNEGDLDGDGADELALVLYNQREWSLCYLFSLKRKAWYQRAEPFMVWGGLDDEDIQKIPGAKGQLRIKHLVPHNDTLLVETHTISIN